jgi:hypothetical protein
VGERKTYRNFSSRTGTRIKGSIKSSSARYAELALQQTRMIRFLLLQNRAGKTRLAKYYAPFSPEERRKLEYDIHRAVVSRDPKHTNLFEVGKLPGLIVV